MKELLDMLRGRYRGFAFLLDRGNSLWELRCFENHRERWCLRGKRPDIEREMRYLLDAVGKPV